MNGNLSVVQGRGPRKKQKSATAIPTSFQLRFAQAHTTGLAQGEGSNLFRWEDSHWKLIQNYGELHRIAIQWLAQYQPDRATHTNACECVKTLSIIADPLPGKTERFLVPLRNTWLEVVDGGSIRLIKPEPSIRVTHQINVTLSASADTYISAPVPQSSLFSRMLTSSLPDIAVRDFVQEYVGYTLMSSCHLQLAQLWVGAGRNGKSSFAKIISALHRKAEALQLDRLNGFELSPLLDASLVVCDETPRNGINQNALKTLISGGDIQINRKHRDPFTYQSNAKWIICCNHLPTGNDQSDGWWRRLAIVEWTRQIPESEVIPDIEKKIINAELHIVLDWALAGLVRLMQRGKFSIPDAVEQAKLRAMLETNSVETWVDETEVHPDPVQVHTKANVYQRYQEYCVRNGRTPCGGQEFWLRFKQKFPGLQETRPNNNGQVRERYVRLRFGPVSPTNETFDCPFDAPSTDNK